MNINLKLVLAIVAAALVFVGSAAALAFIVWSGLDAEYRAPLAMALLEQSALAVFVASLIAAGLGIVMKNLFDTYVMAAQHLVEETKLIATIRSEHRITSDGSRELQRLADEINALADRYRAMEASVQTRVVESRRAIEQENNRFAALMSELTQSVLVCNIEGRILLYNQRALQLLGTPSGADSAHHAEALFGLGRSLFGVMERNVVLHALENIQDRLSHNEAHPVAGFVTTLADGRLIRAQMAPVRTIDATPVAAAEDRSSEDTSRIAGFVLTLEDIQHNVEMATQLGRLLQSLTDHNRSSLANIRAAIENMLEVPEMEPARRRRFEQVIYDEALTLSRRIDAAVVEYSECAHAEWPLDIMLARDFVAAIQRSIENRFGMSISVEGKEELVWLAVDSYSLVQALCYLAERLKEERGVRQLLLRLQPKDRQATLDLVWHGQPLATDTASQWQHAPLMLGSEAASLTFEDIITRHKGQAWYQSDAASGTAYFRILLPLPAHRSVPIELPIAASRPGYYDFDLFHQPGQRPDLDQCLLTELSYTVFDTETTGLAPADGDEIISIGAIRIVNGRLLHGEVFDQLIATTRPLTPASVRIHGIQPAMLEGQPVIARVLPRFHRFCEDTVLVAHNAAFDMRFLQLKEASTGVRFTQPVLDTMMLSAVVHPYQKNHNLEAIATRLGINVIGRHTALGDAIVTGEIFLKLIPLLAINGIRTLQQAREAAQQTPYAHVSY